MNLSSHFNYDENARDWLGIGGSVDLLESIRISEIGVMLKTAAAVSLTAFGAIAVTTLAFVRGAVSFSFPVKLGSVVAIDAIILCFTAYFFDRMMVSVARVRVTSEQLRARLLP